MLEAALGALYLDDWLYAWIRAWPQLPEFMGAGDQLRAKAELSIALPPGAPHVPGGFLAIWLEELGSGGWGQAGADLEGCHMTYDSPTYDDLHDGKTEPEPDG